MQSHPEVLGAGISTRASAGNGLLEFPTGCGTSPITSHGGHIAANQGKGAPTLKPQPQGALSLAGFPEEQKLRRTRRHLWGRKFWVLPVQSINLINTSRDHSDSLPGKARFQTQSVC